MFELNGTYVIFIGLFLVFMYILNETVLKPVARTMAERKARVTANYEAARRHTGEAEGVISNYQAHIHEIRTQAQKVVHDSVAAAQTKREDKLKQLKTEGNAKVTKIKGELVAQRESLIDSLVESELELVHQISNKLLSGAPASSVSRESVHRTLEEIK